jgi:hypothetical protein
MVCQYCSDLPGKRKVPVDEGIVDAELQNEVDELLLYVCAAVWFTTGLRTRAKADA